MCERGVQLRNPFYSIWVTDLGTKFAVSFCRQKKIYLLVCKILDSLTYHNKKQLSFIILAGISAGVYLIFLSYMIWKVFMNISAKRAALPSMSSARRLHYEGVIYRFKFLMIATLLCASLTVIGFMLGQVFNSALYFKYL